MSELVERRVDTRLADLTIDAALQLSRRHRAPTARDDIPTRVGKEMVNQYSAERDCAGLPALTPKDASAARLHVHVHP